MRNPQFTPIRRAVAVLLVMAAALLGTTTDAASSEGRFSAMPMVDMYGKVQGFWCLSQDCPNGSKWCCSIYIQG